MKIAVCGSMVFSHGMLDVGERLSNLEHEVVLPEYIEECAAVGIDKVRSESVDRKVHGDLIRGYFHKIENSDAILVYNPTKDRIEGYIGGNAFLEMSFAHVLNKGIFLYNPIPQLSYTDEIEAMQPTVINGDLSRIK